MRSTFRVLVATLMVLTIKAYPAAAQARQVPGAAAGPTLVLSNRSGQVIEELYISSTRNTDWGDDRLGNNSVEAGATFRIKLAEGCLYDLQVAYADKRTEERMRVNLCRTPTQVFTGAEAHAPPVIPSHEITLENHTSQPITAFAVADTSDAPGDEDFGDNLLATPVRPGDRTQVSFQGDCQMAVRVLFANGSAEQLHAADLCAEAKVVTVAPGWTTQDDLPPTEPAAPLTVANHGTHRLVELYIYPDDGPPGDERLGTRVLEPGATAAVALQRDGKCLFTVRAVFDGNLPDQVQRGIDVCPRRTLDVGAPTP